MVLLLAGDKYFTLYLVGDLDPLPESFSSVSAVRIVFDYQTA